MGNSVAAWCLTRLAPFAAAYPMPERGVAYYLCQNRRCDSPTDNFEMVCRKLRDGKAGTA